MEQVSAVARHRLATLRLRYFAAALPQEKYFADAWEDYSVEMEAFRGSEQELLFAQDLFTLCKRTGNASRWVDLYLALLSRHPTAELITSLADDAYQMAKEAGRGREIRNAFRLVQRLTHLPHMGEEGKVVATVTSLRADTTCLILPAVEFDNSLKLN
jgi:hypothetical protein